MNTTATTTTAWARSQDLSLLTADNWGAGWMLDELELLLSTTDEPVATVAEVLGRTVYAVSTMRARAAAGHTGGIGRRRPITVTACTDCFTVPAASGACLCTE